MEKILETMETLTSIQRDENIEKDLEELWLKSGCEKHQQKAENTCPYCLKDYLKNWEDYQLCEIFKLPREEKS